MERKVALISDAQTQQFAADALDHEQQANAAQLLGEGNVTLAKQFAELVNNGELKGRINSLIAETSDAFRNGDGLSQDLKEAISRMNGNASESRGQPLVEADKSERTIRNDWCAVPPRR